MKYDVSMRIRCDRDHGLSRLPDGQLQLSDVVLASIPCDDYPNHSEALVHVSVEAENPELLAAKIDHVADVLCETLSVVLNCVVRCTAISVKGLMLTPQWSAREKGQQRRRAFPQLNGPVERQRYCIVGQILGLSDAVGLQYLRAARAYSRALTCLETDREIAFVLLCTAIECLAGCDDSFPPLPESQLPADVILRERNCGKTPEESITSRVCRFLDTYVTIPGNCTKGNRTVARRLWRIVYGEYRSAYVHAGEEANIAGRHAEDQGLWYMTYYPAPITPNQKPRRAVSLAWYSECVNIALLNYALQHGSGAETSLDLIEQAVARRATTGIHVRPKRRPLEAGKRFELRLDEIDHSIENPNKWVRDGTWDCPNYEI